MGGMGERRRAWGGVGDHVEGMLREWEGMGGRRISCGEGMWRAWDREALSGCTCGVRVRSG